MKKFVLALLILVVAATGAFAQAVIAGAAFEGTYTALDYGTKTDTLSDSWGWGDNYVVFGAATDNVGGALNIYYSADPGLPIYAQMSAWYKPFDFLKINAGAGWNDDTFRGTIGGIAAYGFWAGARYGGDSEDYIFARANGNVGLNISVAGFSAVVTAAALSDPAETWADSLHAALGYKVEGVGLFRAQYVGKHGKNGDIYGKPRIEAAAQLAFDPVNIDLGVKIPIGDDVPTVESDGVKKYEDGQADLVVALGATVGLGDFSIGLRADVDVGFGTDDPLALGVTIVPAYKISDNLDVGAAVGINLESESSVVKFDAGVSAWAIFGFGSGKIRPGIRAKFGDNEEFHIDIPVYFYYGF